jgi:hypothetical protein
VNLHIGEVHIHVHLHGDPDVAGAILELKEEIRTMGEASERLAQEVAETKQAVIDLEARYQAKIDAQATEIQNLKDALANGDTAAATAAADALDALQQEMAGMAQFGGGSDTTTAPAGGDDTLSGGAGTDTVTGDASLGNDTIDSGAGNDSVDAGTGADTVDAGAAEPTPLKADE